MSVRSHGLSGAHWVRARWRSRLSIAGLAVLLGGLPIGGAQAEDPPVPDRPLGLDEVIELALARNLAFQQSQLGIETAEGSLKSARSQLLPTLRGGIGYTRSVANFSVERFDPESGLLLEANDTNVTVESSLRFSGGLPLLDPGVWENVRSSSRSLDATLEDVARARQNLAFTMTQRFYELVRAKQLTQVSGEAFSLAEEQLARAQALYELGSVARSDVLQAQVNLASADRDRISAENRVEQEKARLAVAIGAPVGTPVDVMEPEAPREVPPIEDERALLVEARAGRPDLAAAALGLDAARHGLSASRWARWPTVNASYSWSKRGDAPADVLREFDRDISYGAGLSLDWNLFDGWNTKGAIQRSQAEVATRQRALEEAQLQAELEVREARLAINNATESIRSTEEGVALAEESAKLQQALYESGGGTLLEWNNAQVELTRARVSLVEAQVDLRLALAQLELALGRLGAQ